MFVRRIIVLKSGFTKLYEKCNVGTMLYLLDLVLEPLLLIINFDKLILITIVYTYINF